MAESVFVEFLVDKKSSPENESDERLEDLTEEDLAIAG